MSCSFCNHCLYLQVVFMFLSIFFLLLPFGEKIGTSFCCPPYACPQPGSSAVGPAVWGHTENCVRELGWLQSDAESSTHRRTVPAGLIAASWWFNLHIFLPSACLSISFISILRINLSLAPSARTGWGQCLYIFHCNLGSLKCSVLTEIVPTLHCLLFEMLLNFWCTLRQLIMDKAWLYQETSVEWLL